MKKITLILGGIRSGKSHFAEQKAEYYDEKPIYIATAIPFDGEMKLRVIQHQKRRKNRYELLEAPYDIIGPLSKLKNRTILVDCLTLNLSNRLMATKEYMDLEELIETDEEYLKDIYNIIIKNNLNIIFVSNEVGFSPVEANQMGRFFQDLQGRWNRMVAEFADEVYMIQAGIPTLIKKESTIPFKISAPSYIMPSGYIENVTYLMDKVDDIQLLAFDSPKDDPLLKKETLQTLEYLAKDSNFTYSLHMPVKPKISENIDPCLNKSLHIIEKIKPLNISTFTFHYDLPNNSIWNNLKSDERKEIESFYINFFQKIKEEFPTINISLENTATPLSALDQVISETDISYCIDIGHLLVQSWDLSEIKTRLPKTSVIHLHGWEQTNGKKQDHRTIGFDKKIFKTLESFNGILTIENYHPQLLKKSLKVLKEYF